MREPTASPRKLSYLVADALRARVASGELRPGDKLPSEAALLQEFGVSRSTLREALRVVESEGLINLGRGARTGAKVLGPSIETAARYGQLYLAVQKTTLREVHQMRTLLEPPLVSLLASEPRNPQLELLESCVRSEMRSLAKQDFVATTAELNKFHSLLISLSRNHALSLLAGIVDRIPAQIYTELLEGRDRVTQQSFKRRTHRSVAAHEELVALICAGRRDAAEDFWRRYQIGTARFLEKTGLADLKVRLRR